MPYPIEAQLLSGIGVLAVAVGLLLAGRRYGRDLDELAPLELRPERLRRPLSLVRRLGAYTLEAKIGAGAMGEVYRAWHGALNRACAIKVLRAEASEGEHGRFAQEARLTAQVGHPNTVAVYDYGRVADGTSYYVMELLEGITLQKLVERDGALPAHRVLGILRQLCAALQATHAAGLVHRDVKPDNVVLCLQNGTDLVKLLDFGLVKQVGGAEDELADMVLGTPLYMSPEAVSAPQTVDARSDLYGLGALAYFLLTGSPVFEGDSVVEVCSQHLHAQPERPSRVVGHALPEELEQIVLTCLAKDPDARPASADELARSLDRCAATWSDVADESRSDLTHVSRRHTDTVACRVHTLHRARVQQRACA